MTVVRFSYYYARIDVDHEDIYLEVKFKDKTTLEEYLTAAKNAFKKLASERLFSFFIIAPHLLGLLKRAIPCSDRIAQTVGLHTLTLPGSCLP